MPIKAYITGPRANRQALVDKGNALRVAQYSPELPEIGTASRYRYYRAKLGSTGADSGTVNMNVNGSVTAQEFYIEAHADYDLYFMLAVIVIADTAVVHSNFGNVGALGTGWDLKVTEAGVETFIIEKAKTGGQVIVQSGLGHAYGDGAQAFEMLNWTGTEDAQTAVVPFHHILPGGLRIGRGTQDRLQSIVNDDLTGLTEFTVYGIGYRHYDP